MNAAKQKKMASKQISQNKFITQAVAKAAKAAIQTMAMASTSRQANVGLKMSVSIMKQPTFNWNAGDNYEGLRNFNIEVGNVLPNYNLGQHRKYL